jgi:hypothetical protein
MTSPKQATTRGGKRTYSWRGEEYWSVTTIIGGGIPKPALLPWGIKMVAEGAADAVADGILGPMVERDRDGAVRYLKGLPYAKRDAAGDLGTLVHAWIEAWSLKKPMPKPPLPVQPYLKAFQTFLDDFEPTFTATEASVFSKTQKYAGTLDSIATLTLPMHPEPGTYILDAKSGKGVYPEVGLQLAAYRHAEFIGLPDGSEEEMPRVDGALCLHLTPEGYRLIEVRADEEIFNAFLYAREVFRFLQDTSKTVLGLEYGPTVTEEVAV